jgi:alpha-1,3-rhamnosyltransferase
VNDNIKKFTNVKVLLGEKNNGITFNFNKAISCASGEWIKIIAGDDILLKDCITNDLQYIKQHPETEYLITNMKVFTECEEHELSRGMQYYCNLIDKLEPEKQLEKLQWEDTKVSPTQFFSKEMLQRIGLGENPIRNIEDWPFRLHVVSNGVKIHYLETPTVKYRVGNSISHRQNQIYNQSHIDSVEKLEKELILPNVKKHKILYKMNFYIEFFRYHTIIKMGNSDNTVTRCMNCFLMCFQPYLYVKLFRKLKYTLLPR